MAYAIDFVIDCMRRISSHEPVLFQRDGSLYVASKEGFGQVTYGLSTTPEERYTGDKVLHLPELLESEEVIEEKSRGLRFHQTKFKNDEERYMRPIAFGGDSDSFSLDEITQAASQLAKLPDDGKIRMIRHRSDYHSHKYGYASDGIDVWVEEARVMNKDRYMELMKKKEEQLLLAMEREAEPGPIHPDLSKACYLQLPNLSAFILTPCLLVSLPRSGKFDLNHKQPNSWTGDTRLLTNQRDILRYYAVDMYSESPYGITVNLNAGNIVGINEDEMKRASNGLFNEISRQVNAVTSALPLVEEFISRMNTLHNKACAPNIEYMRKLSEKRAS